MLFFRGRPRERDQELTDLRALVRDLKTELRHTQEKQEADTTIILSTSLREMLVGSLGAISEAHARLMKAQQDSLDAEAERRQQILTNSLVRHAQMRERAMNKAHPRDAQGRLLPALRSANVVPGCPVCADGGLGRGCTQAEMFAHTMGGHMRKNGSNNGSPPLN
jgi:hypothetical protein